MDGGGRIVYDWQGRYAGSPYHQYPGSPVTTVGGMHWVMPDDDQVFGTASLNKQHVPGNGPLDDDTLQREQASFWMAQQIGLPRQNRRYYVFYVNGNRHGPLMEDAQVPDDGHDQGVLAQRQQRLALQEPWLVRGRCRATVQTAT